MDKFVEWERTQTRRQSYSAFARYLGIKVPLLTQWRLGNNLPSMESAIILADKLGHEVYTVLGFSDPNDPLTKYPVVAQAIQAAAQRVEAAGIDPDSPEVIRIFAEELARKLQEY